MVSVISTIVGSRPRNSSSSTVSHSSVQSSSLGIEEAQLEVLDVLCEDVGAAAFVRLGVDARILPAHQVDLGP